MEANLSNYPAGSREDVRDVDLASDRCADSPVFDFAPGLAVDGGGRLVDADVVYFHPLWPDVVGYALLPAPCAADGDIEQQVEGLVEGHWR